MLVLYSFFSLMASCFSTTMKARERIIIRSAINQLIPTMHVLYFEP